jgi:hypothetical protein
MEVETNERVGGGYDMIYNAASSGKCSDTCRTFTLMVNMLRKRRT